MNMCDFGQNTNESLTLRKEFISEQKMNILRVVHYCIESISKKKSLELIISYLYHHLLYY